MTAALDRTSTVIQQLTEIARQLAETQATARQLAQQIALDPINGLTRQQLIELAATINQQLLHQVQLARQAILGAADILGEESLTLDSIITDTELNVQTMIQMIRDIADRIDTPDQAAVCQELSRDAAIRLTQTTNRLHQALVVIRNIDLIVDFNHSVTGWLQQTNATTPTVDDFIAAVGRIELEYRMLTGLIDQLSAAPGNNRQDRDALAALRRELNGVTVGFITAWYMKAIEPIHQLANQNVVNQQTLANVLTDEVLPRIRLIEDSLRLVADLLAGRWDIQKG